MGVTISPVHNRTSTINKSGKYSVSIRVTINRKVNYLSINNFPKISKSDWDKRFNKIKNTHSNNFELNKILTNHVSKIENFVANCILHQKPITYSYLKNYYEKYIDRKEAINFIQFSERYTREREDISFRTKLTYTAFLNVFEKLNGQPMVEHIDRKMVEDYVDYLKKRKNKGNTIQKHLIKFSHLYRRALREANYSADTDIFSNLNIKASTSNRVAISLDEIKLLRDLSVPDFLRIDLDLFLFLCGTGLYMSDVLQGTRSKHLQQSNKGFYLSNERFKNDNPYIIPLWIFDWPMEILDKYKTTTSDVLIPYTKTEQRFNKNLKTIAKKANIHKTLYNKVGRHTFTDLCAAKGIATAMISKMLGHTSIKTTEGYMDLKIYHLEELI